MLNASYNLKLRNVRAYIPEYPVGTAEECADMIHDFLPIARGLIGLSDLKIISFGPRPLNFLACNAPIKQLYNLGVEIEENSELDLFEAYHKHDGDPRIPAKVKEMEEELGGGQQKTRDPAEAGAVRADPARLGRGAQRIQKICCHRRQMLAAFQTQFGFVPCYVNSRSDRHGHPGIL